MTRRYHANNYSSTLATNITSSATSITVTSATGLPAIGANETYRLTLSSINGAREIVIVTDDASSPVLTVTRGAEGTTAQVFLAGANVQLQETADSYDRKQDTIATAGDVINFGDATSLEIPNSASPALTVTGQVALDTSVTDYADGLPLIRQGSTSYALISIPLSGMSSPTNNHVVTYDSTLDQFKLAAGGGGGGSPGGSTTQVQYNSAGSFAGAAGFTFDGTGTATTTVALNTATVNASVGAIVGGNSTASGYLRLLEDSDNGTNYTGFQAPASLAGNVVYTLPSADGSSGQVLSTNGSATLSWATGGGGGGGTSGALQFIESKTASASANLSFTNLGNYSYVQFVFANVKPATDAVLLHMRTSTNGGSSYDSGATDYAFAAHYMPSSGAWASANSAGTTEIRLTGAISVGNSTGEKVCGTLDLYDPTAADYAMASGQIMITTASTVTNVITCSGTRLASADVDAVQFYFSSGNIASGTIYVYGMSKTAPGGGSSVIWNEVTGTSQTAAINNAYIANNASLVTITLPATAAVGDTVEVVGKGAGLWRLAANTGQTIKMGSSTTTSAGSLTATAQYDSILVACVTANTTWVVRGPVTSGFTIA